MKDPVIRRRLGKVALVAAVMVVGVVGVRQSVAQVYYVPLGSMEPELPRGSRILVFKLAGDFAPGDIAAFRHTTGETYLGRVEAADAATGALTVTRNGTGPIVIPAREIIGRVVLSTR